MKEGSAFVYEDSDHDHFLTGRFDAHWERDGDRRPPRVTDVTFEEALEWARARAPVVIVSFGAGQRYSAGDEPDPEFPPLPARVGPFVRRRDPEFAFLDRTSADPPIRWRGWITFTVDPGPLGDVAPRLIEAVRADPRATSLDGEADPRDSGVEVEVELSARTYDEALALADAILHAAMETVGPAGFGASSFFAGVANFAPAGDC